MNIRFAEACRNASLVLEGYEVQVAKESGLDGRTQREVCTSCEKDIFIGIFFDGTNNGSVRISVFEAG